MTSAEIQALEATVAKLQHYQSTLQDYSRLLASYIPVERLLPLTALRLVRGVGISHSKVLRHDDTRGDLLLEAGMGWKPGAIGQAHFSIDAASPPGRTYQTRTPSFIGDLPNSAEFRYSDFMRDHGIRSLVNAPIVSGGVVWGVLEMDSTDADRFDEHDARFLLTMANILGVAIERAADHDAARSAMMAAAAAAADAASVKDLRLREMQHRMKNHLAVISSMLLLEQRHHADGGVKARLRALMDRVTAIGMAHDQLNARQQDTAVDLAPYLGQLAGNLALQHGSLRVETALDKVVVPLDHAVPLGLIVNELMTNAAKYAFPGGTGGTVWVELSCDQDLAEGLLAVADDGVGMGPPRPGSMGGMLLEGLAQQVGGTLDRPAIERGTRVEVRFPISGAV
ncbi:histidine kinase dimerization/phosphoacceptor domain -containing protein [Azospirillum sp. SYSU D00513]|uniref:sensor histidine kinase n=1 Tax=Azospirillum sp. SYSU D00513 TaxID=2812561 RepID=UPI001A961465|nr:histidine kinase dimerization/phosphoacceptor domain -containing protein [Azospirillum sp. SYSU D00513]